MKAAERFANGYNLSGTTVEIFVMPKPVCLTIAGLDPSGGAGIIADIKTFSSFGCFGAAAVSSITFQNTVGVFGAEHQTAESVRRQIEPIIEDYEIAALKTGMLPTREVIEVTGHLIGRMGAAKLIVDPVVRSTSGFDLIDDDALRSLIKVLVSTVRACYAEPGRGRADHGATDRHSSRCSCGR